MCGVAMTRDPKRYIDSAELKSLGLANVEETEYIIDL